MATLALVLEIWVLSSIWLSLFLTGVFAVTDRRRHHAGALASRHPDAADFTPSAHW